MTHQAVKQPHRCFGPFNYNTWAAWGYPLNSKSLSQMLWHWAKCFYHPQCSFLLHHLSSLEPNVMVCVFGGFPLNKKLVYSIIITLCCETTEFSIVHQYLHINSMALSLISLCCLEQERLNMVTMIAYKLFSHSCFSFPVSNQCNNQLQHSYPRLSESNKIYFYISLNKYSLFSVNSINFKLTTP